MTALRAVGHPTNILPPPKLRAPKLRTPKLHVFGFDAIRMHDHYWSSRGLNVIRCGVEDEATLKAGPYLLLDDESLALFDEACVRRRGFQASKTTWIKIVQDGSDAYSEHVECDQEHQFIAFHRRYQPTQRREQTVIITKDVDLARRWSRARNPRHARADARATGAFRTHVVPFECDGVILDSTNHAQAQQLFLTLMKRFDPSSLVSGEVRQVGPTAFAHRLAHISPYATITGAAWIGAGQVVLEGDVVVGPCVLPDLEVISATPHQAPFPTTRTEFSRDTPRDRGERLAELRERLFNLSASFLLLMLTLPLYPILMLIIWLEDGRPFFFAHERQMKGGKFFRCYKFRTMCRDAEKLKGSLQGINNADGPQFHIPIDPRLTRCGRWMRRFHLDELPQFFNVLKGEMNLVGPRPSPENENQCCPAWREIRLSVRPGITGLWQVCRTRKPHLDFQEWIRYDIEYVRHRSMKLDQWILWRTIRVLLFTK